MDLSFLDISLLNQSRLRALEDLEKIFSEKEALQAKINVLETKLAETDVRIKVAALGNVNVRHLENQLKKLKNEMSSRSSTEEGNIDENVRKIQHVEIVPLDAVSLPLNEELISLRKENMLLMQDIQALKAQINDVEQTEERALMLEKEKSLLEAAIKELEFRLATAQEDVSRLTIVKSECETLWGNVENSQVSLDDATSQANQVVKVLEQNHELQRKVEKLEMSLEEANVAKVLLPKTEQCNEQLQQKIKLLEERLQMSLENMKEEGTRNNLEKPGDDMPWDFWSRVLLTIDGWLFEKKIPSNDAKLLRELAWKKDSQIRDIFLACKGEEEQEALEMLLKLTRR